MKNGAIHKIIGIAITLKHNPQSHKIIAKGTSKHPSIAQSSQLCET